MWDMEQRGHEWVVGATLAKHKREIYADGPDELTTRYRLALLCVIAGEKTT